jgi:hypothetical protein
MTAHRIQESPYFCFLACLQSFLEEQGEFHTQREILNKTPEIFGGSPDDLGGFAGYNFPRIDLEYGLETTSVPGPAPVTPKESVFVFCYWEDNPKQPHWVRYLDHDAKDVLLMNPGSPKCPDRVPISDFATWAKTVYRVRKK